MARILKVHCFDPGTVNHQNYCGTGSVSNTDPARITCRICMFRFLAAKAPWAEQFMRELRAAPPGTKTSEPRPDPVRSWRHVKGCNDALCPGCLEVL